MTVGCRRGESPRAASLQQLQGTCLAGADVGRIVMATHFTPPRTTCAVSTPELRTTSCRGSVATPSDERLRRRAIRCSPDGSPSVPRWSRTFAPTPWPRRSRSRHARCVSPMPSFVSGRRGSPRRAISPGLPPSRPRCLRPAPCRSTYGRAPRTRGWRTRRPGFPRRCTAAGPSRVCPRPAASSGNGGAVVSPRAAAPAGGSTAPIGTYVGGTAAGSEDATFHVSRWTPRGPPSNSDDDCVHPRGPCDRHSPNSAT
jgi:hypothetical protein